MLPITDEITVLSLLPPTPTPTQHPHPHPRCNKWDLSVSDKAPLLESNRISSSLYSHNMG